MGKEILKGKNDDSQCLICYQTISEEKLEHHFSSKYKNYDEKYPLGSQSRTEKLDLLQKA